MRRIRRYLALICLSATLVGAPQMFHEPGGYHLPSYLRPAEIPKVADSIQLLPAAKRALTEAAQIRSGESVVVVTDPSIPKLVEQAFVQALNQAKHSYEILQLPAFSPPLNAVPWPQHIWDRVARADVTLSLSFLSVSGLETTLEDRLKPGGRLVTVSALPELLGSSWAEVPRELVEMIQETALSSLKPKGLLEIQDAGGTHLNFVYQSIAPKGLDGAIRHFPLESRLAFQAAPGQTHGSLTSHSTAKHFHPLLDLDIRGGSVHRIHGGGQLGETMQALQGERTGLRLGSIEFSLGPQGFRFPGTYTGSAKLWGHFAGAQKPGSMLLNWMHGTQLFGHSLVFYPTVRESNRPWLQEGYPSIFFNPGIRQLAASLGSAETLIPQCILLPEEVPVSREPEIRRVTELDSILPAIETSLDDYLNLSSGEEVLLILEDDQETFVLEAFEEELRRRNHPFEVLRLSHEKAPATDPLELGRILSGTHLDSQALEQLSNYSAVILLPCSDPVDWWLESRRFEELIDATNTRVMAVIPSPEILASSWARFPLTLHETIHNEVLKRVEGASTGIITSGQGASLIFDFRARRATENLIYFPPSSRVELIPESDRGPDGDGILTFSRFLSLPIPTLRMEMEGAQMLTADGAGAVTRFFKRQIANSASGGTLSRIRVGINPKAFPYCPEDRSLPNWGCMAGRNRSGMADFVFSGPFQHSGENQSRNFQMLFPNINAGGDVPIADRGHLGLLDEEEIQDLAGEAATQLLAEEWIPALRPQN